jgi:hypothetical protein
MVPSYIRANANTYASALIDREIPSDRDAAKRRHMPASETFRAPRVLRSGQHHHYSNNNVTTVRLGGVQKRLSNAQWKTRKGNALEAAEIYKQVGDYVEHGEISSANRTWRWG